MRKAGIVAAVVGFFLVIAVLLLPRLVSLDSFRPRIVAALEEKTGRTIGLSGLSLSLFPGIGVEVTQLTVSGGARHPGERLPSAAAARAPGAPPEKPKEKVAGAVSEIRVEEAKLSFRQEEKGGRESAWEISPFTLRVSGIGETQKEFEVRTRIEGTVRGDIFFTGRLTGRRGGGTGRPAAALRGEGMLFGQKVAVEGKIFPSQQPFAVALAISFPGVEMGKTPAMFPVPPEGLGKARLEGV